MEIRKEKLDNLIGDVSQWKSTLRKAYSLSHTSYNAKKEEYDKTLKKMFDDEKVLYETMLETGKLNAKELDYYNQHVFPIQDPRWSFLGKMIL